MKPSKHQSNKQKRQDLCWKVHDPAQSFVLRPYTMHELRNQHVSIGVSPSVPSKTTIVFCAGSRSRKRTKTYSKELCQVS